MGDSRVISQNNNTVIITMIALPWDFIGAGGLIKRE